MKSTREICYKKKKKKNVKSNLLEIKKISFITSDESPIKKKKKEKLNSVSRTKMLQNCSNHTIRS